MEEAKELLAEGVEVGLVLKEYEKREKEIKDRLAEIAGMNEQTGEGFKFGHMATVITRKSRATLNKDLLLQNGVEPEIINASMKETEYTEVRVYDLTR